MIRELGSYNTATTRTHVRFQFSTHASAGGNVAPSSAFEAADIRIYRANDSAAYSATQRSSSNGITMTSPFDSLTGVHDVDIDLTDNTDAGFYAAGYRYSVVLAPDETVDSQTITGVVLAEFEIGPPPANVTQLLGTAWLTPGTPGTPDVNVKLVGGSATPVTNLGVVFNTDFATNYDSTNDRWTVNVKTWNDLTTVALPLTPTTAGRTLDVSAGGEAGIDWANVGTPGSTVNLSATTINLVNTATAVTNQLTAAQIATGIWQDSTASDFTTASSIGKALYINNVAPGGSGGLLISGSNSGTTTFGALTVTGATTLTGAVSLGSTLTVTGATTLAAVGMTTLTASGAVAFQSTLAVTGATTLTGAVTATNASNDIRGVALHATQAAYAPATVGAAMTLTSAYDFARGTVAVTESYNTDGAAPTPVQALMLILQALTEGSISSTTWTIKKLDGSTTAATITLDSATTPTSKTRAT